jgi:hypothetical protein
MKIHGIIGYAALVTGLIATGAYAGTISGTVTFAGDPVPAPETLAIDKDVEVCGKEHKSDELMISGKNKGVMNAVVSIKEIKTDKKLSIPKDKLKFVQDKCSFSPRVLVLPVKTEFEILNKDPLTHNIHTFGKDNATINRGQPKTVPVITHSFDVPERIKVKCDIHKWMQGWFIVSADPYVALSNANGGFTIKDVPPGTYTLEVWHEGLGSDSQEVTVKGEEEVKVTFGLEEKKRRSRRK